MFPLHRPRRLRRSEGIRRLVRETLVAPNQLVLPLFFNANLSEPVPIVTMPGISQLPLRDAARTAEAVAEAQLGGVILFGLPSHKDARGSSAFDPAGPVPAAIQAMKEAAPELVVMADVCVDEYTEHGHCGILKEDSRGEWVVDNDATLEVLAETALCYTRAGADVVAPSDMMDGRVARIREALDDEGFSDTAILSYAVKYASSFYGPFRDAANCAPKFGDRSGYQMDPANRREALREVEADEEEGADMLMVKPGMPYLDIVADVRRASALPLGVYNVSGEYAMIKAAAAANMIDERRAVLELLTSFRRAGADFILTYHALDAARWLAS
jgi:porphobilinogen synthase